MGLQWVVHPIYGVLAEEVVEVCLAGDKLLLNAIDCDLGQILRGFDPSLRAHGRGRDHY